MNKIHGLDIDQIHGLDIEDISHEMVLDKIRGFYVEKDSFYNIAAAKMKGLDVGSILRKCASLSDEFDKKIDEINKQEIDQEDKYRLADEAYRAIEEQFISYAAEKVSCDMVDILREMPLNHRLFA